MQSIVKWLVSYVFLSCFPIQAYRSKAMRIREFILNVARDEKSALSLLRDNQVLESVDVRCSGKEESIFTRIKREDT